MVIGLPLASGSDYNVYNNNNTNRVDRSKGYFKKKNVPYFTIFPECNRPYFSESSDK